MPSASLLALASPRRWPALDRRAASLRGEHHQPPPSPGLRIQQRAEVRRRQAMMLRWARELGGPRSIAHGARPYRARGLALRSQLVMMLIWKLVDSRSFSSAR